MSRGFEDAIQLLGVRSEPPSPEVLALKTFQSDRLEITTKLLELERLSAKNPVAKRIRERIAAAQQQVDRNQVEDGTRTLDKRGSLREIAEATELAKEAYLRMIDETNKRRKEEFKQLENKQLFLADLETAQKAELELAGLSQATSEHNSVVQMIQKAREAESRGDYVQGRRELTRVSEVLKAGRKKQETDVNEAKRAFEGVFRLKGETEKSLRESLTLHAKEREALQLRLDQVIQPALGKKYSKGLYDQILENLESVIDDVQHALKQSDDAAKSAELSLKTCTLALQETQLVTTVSERASLERDARNLDAWIEQRDFQRVIAAESGFLAEAKRLRDEVKEAKDQWDQLRPLLKEWISTCDEWDKLNSPALRDFSPSPVELGSQFATLEKAKVGEDMAYPTAVHKFQDFQHNGVVIRSRLETYDEFVKSRDEIAKGVKSEINKAKEALRNLLERSDRTIRQQEGNPLDSGGRFGERLKEIEQRWQSSFDSAVAVTELIDAEIIELAKKLAREVAAMTDPHDYRKLLGDEKLAKARQEFKAQVPGVRDKLDELRKFASPRQAELEKSLQTLISRAEAAPDEQTARQLARDLQVLDTQIHAEIWVMQRDTLTLRSDAVQVHRRIGGKLDNFDNTIKRYATSFLTRNPQYEEYSKTLQREWLGMSHVSEEYDRDVLQQAMADMLLLEKRVDQALDGLQRGATTKDEPVLENVVEQVNRAKTLLKDNESLTLYMADEKGKLDQRLKDIDGDKTGRPFDESLQALADWNTSYLEAAKKAALAARDYAELETQVNEAKKLFKTHHDALEPFQNYLASLKQRLDKALEDGKSASGVKAAADDVKKLVEEINKAVTEPDAMREASDVAIARDQEKNNQQHEWEGLVKRFDERTLPELKEKKVRSDLYQEVVKLGDLAKETFKRSQDFEMARGQLDLATRRAKDALAFPQGASVHARTELPKAAKQWGEAVRDLRTALNDLIEQIRKADPEHQQKESTQKAANELGKVGDLYLEGAFTKVADRLAQLGLDEAEVRAAREDGLRAVRQYQSLLLKDMRTQLLFDNPFVKPFRALNTLNHTLLNLEYNLLLIK